MNHKSAPSPDTLLCGSLSFFIKKRLIRHPSLSLPRHISRPCQQAELKYDIIKSIRLQQQVVDLRLAEMIERPEKSAHTPIDFICTAPHGLTAAVIHGNGTVVLRENRRDQQDLLSRSRFHPIVDTVLIGNHIQALGRIEALRNADGYQRIRPVNAAEIDVNLRLICKGNQKPSAVSFAFV